MSSNRYSNSDTWNTTATNYVTQVANATSQSAERLIALTNPIIPFSSSHSRVLDNGAGTGALTIALNRKFPGMHIVAADISDGMLTSLRAQGLANVETKVLDACVENNPTWEGEVAFSHAISMFMTQFTSQPMNIVREMHRMLQPGGVIAFATWLDVGINWPWTAACRRLDPDFVPRSPFDDSAWASGEDVEKALTDIGFKVVMSERVKPVMRIPGGGETFVNNWYNNPNPGMLKMQSAWKNGEGVEEVRETLQRVLQEEFNGGREFEMDAVITVAIKEE